MKKAPTPIECRDTGMAMTLVALLVAVFAQSPSFIYVAIALLLVTMIWPGCMSYPAKLWFGMSAIISAVMNRVILSVLFFLIVVPIAFIRKILGKDALRLRQYRNGKTSAFVVRDHVFGKEDLDNVF